MRSTLTLDTDVSRLLHDRMKLEDKPYKQVVNEAIRDGLRARESTPITYVSLSFSLGVPIIDLTKANAFAVELEDQEIKAKLTRIGKKLVKSAAK